MPLDSPNTLLVVALKPEWIFLKRRLHFTKIDFTFPLYRIEEFPGTCLLQTGAGLERSGLVIRDALQIFPKIRGVFHFGLSGALCEDLHAESLIVCDRIVGQLTQNGDALSVDCDTAVHAHLQNVLKKGGVDVHTGALFTSPIILKNRAEKITAHSKWRANAVDMESLAVANICQENGIAYTSVRGIFDALSDDLETMGEPYDAAGNLKTLALAGNLIKTPHLILTLPHLKRRMDRIGVGLTTAVLAYLKRPQSQ